MLAEGRDHLALCAVPLNSIVEGVTLALALGAIGSVDCFPVPIVVSIEEDIVDCDCITIIGSGWFKQKCIWPSTATKFVKNV